MLRQYSILKQLENALHTKNSILKLSVCIFVPAACLILVFASYFGFLPLEHWVQNIKALGALEIPSIGLKEILVFAFTVEGLTFLKMRRKILF